MHIGLQPLAVSAQHIYAMGIRCVCIPVCWVEMGETDKLLICFLLIPLYFDSSLDVGIIRVKMLVGSCASFELKFVMLLLSWGYEMICIFTQHTYCIVYWTTVAPVS